MAFRARNTGRKIEFKQWDPWNSGTAFLALSAGVIGTVLFSVTESPYTIMRSRGSLTAWIDGAQSGGQAIRVAVGMILVPEGSGSTVQYNPIADANAGWFFYSTFTLGYEEMVTDVIDVPGLSSYREVIDVKAMRRVGPQQEIQMVVENGTIGSAASLNLVSDGRFLRGVA